MAEYIGCRNCGSPNCKGCNIYTLATMLENGKFDCLMNGNRAINSAADVVEVVHGEWVQKDLFARYHWMFNCSCCGNPVYDWAKPFNYCPNCGADMRRDTNG